jgi:hypothetical protein
MLYSSRVSVGILGRRVPAQVASSRLLELSEYTPIEVGGIRSIRRNEVVTVLTRSSSIDFAFGARIGRIQG